MKSDGVRRDAHSPKCRGECSLAAEGAPSDGGSLGVVAGPTGVAAQRAPFEVPVGVWPVGRRAFLRLEQRPGATVPGKVVRETDNDRCLQIL